MAQTGGLKKKGAPPARGEAKSVITADPRPSEGKNVPLQVRIAPDVFDAYTREANERFNFEPGAKSKLFRDMWEIYLLHKD